MSDPAEPSFEATEGYSGAPAGTDEVALAALTESRVAEVIDAMEAGTFRRGLTGREFARAWGVCEQRAREIVAIASKRVRAQLTDPDALACEVVPALTKAMHDAVAKGDARGAAALGAQLLDVGGLKTQKTELTGKDGAPLAPGIYLPPESDE